MAFFDCHFFSDALGLTVSAYVLLPQRTSRQIGLSGQSAPAAHGWPTLTLLHGLSDDHTIWMRRSSIERHASELGCAVVMPAVGRSFYQDTASGARYWTFLSEELPGLMRGFFPLSTRREENMVAGLSMGGYGALRLALAHPAQYSAAASFSGALDVGRICRQAGRKGSRLNRAEVEGIFGSRLEAEETEADLWTLARGLASGSGPKPRLFLSCGTEDELRGENQKFSGHLTALGLPHSYEERPGGHEWAFWDGEIQRFLGWLAAPAVEIER